MELDRKASVSHEEGGSLCGPPSETYQRSRRQGVDIARHEQDAGSQDAVEHDIGLADQFRCSRGDSGVSITRIGLADEHDTRRLSLGEGTFVYSVFRFYSQWLRRISFR